MKMYDVELSPVRTGHYITKNHRKVINWANLDNVEAAIMGATGQTTSHIIAEVGDLSPGQVAYRLKKLGIRRSDWRNGRSEIYKLVMSQIARGEIRQRILDLVFKSE